MTMDQNAILLTVSPIISGVIAGLFAYRQGLSNSKHLERIKLIEVRVAALNDLIKNLEGTQTDLAAEQNIFTSKPMSEMEMSSRIIHLTISISAYLSEPDRMELLPKVENYRKVNSKWVGDASELRETYKIAIDRLSYLVAARIKEMYVERNFGEFKSSERNREW